MIQTDKPETVLPLEREEICRFIINQAADGILLIDTETLRFVEFNDAACRGLGYTCEEFATLWLANVQAVMRPEEALLRMAELVKAGGGTVETRHRCKNGEIRDCLASNRLVRIGGRDYMTTVWVDITERKRADARMVELNRSLQLRVAELETILETVPIGIAIASDAEFNHVRGNPAFETMLGVELGGNCSATEPLDDPSMFRVTRDGRELAPDELPMRMAVAKGVAIRQQEFDVLHRDGSVVTICGNAAPLFDEQGNVRGAVGAIWDISEQRRAKAAMECACKAAESANRAKSEFLANMSHEIRTPMTAILGFADLLMSPDLPRDDQLEFLRGIQKNGAALLELIGDILDLSQIEADRLKVRKTDCHLQPMIDDVAAAATVLAEAKGLSLTVERESPLPETIHTDSTRLRQILVNLLVNAVKFTDQGGVRLTVRAIDRADAPLQMQFTVVDTGCGIAADMLDKIFLPFTQVDASASRRHGGAGLGLAISKRLAAMLGGAIEVASQCGRGSTFTLTIDAGSRKSMAPPPLPSHAQTAASDASHDRQDSPLFGRLLLVEDDADVQRVLRVFLRKMNLNADVAKDGRSACEMAETSRREGRPYDLILMDIQMPVMNGYEAARELRNRGWLGPILALTAHAMGGDRERCLAAGCDDYLAKPATMASLRAMLTRYLDNGGERHGDAKDAEK